MRLYDRFYDVLALLLAVAALLAGASHTRAATFPIRRPTDGGPGEVQAPIDGSNGVSSGHAYADGGKAPAAADSDFDGVIDYDDNCPSDPNPGQEDGDGDGLGDACDACPNTPSGDPVDGYGCSTDDDDGDGVLNDQDACPNTAAGDPVDVSGWSTADDDADGVLNDQDDCPETLACATVDTNGCPSDSDGDGVVDGCDECADTPQGAAVDASGCPTGCCGASGPVAPLGLAIGMLLLSRFDGYRSARRRRWRDPLTNLRAIRGAVHSGRPCVCGAALLLIRLDCCVGRYDRPSVSRDPGSTPARSPSPLGRVTSGSPSQRLIAVVYGHSDGRRPPSKPDATVDSALYFAPVLKLQTTPVVVPPSLTSSIRQ